MNTNPTAFRAVLVLAALCCAIATAYYQGRISVYRMIEHDALTPVNKNKTADITEALLHATEISRACENEAMHASGVIEDQRRQISWLRAQRKILEPYMESGELVISGRSK